MGYYGLQSCSNLETVQVTTPITSNTNMPYATMRLETIEKMTSIISIASAVTELMHLWCIPLA